MAEYRVEGNNFYHGFDHVGTIDGDRIQDAHFNRLGDIEGNVIKDTSFSKVAEIDGSDVNDAHWNRIAKIDEIRKLLGDPDRRDTTVA